MKYRKLLLLLMLISAAKAVTAQSQDNSTRFQIFSGHHFQERTDYIPYEAIIPAIFTTTILTKPKVDPWTTESNLSDCSETQDLCTIQNNLATLHNLIIDQINSNYLNTELSNQSFSETRSKRGLLFLQNFFEWCCDLANKQQISNIYENQKGIEEHTNKIIDSVGTQYQDLVKTTTNLNNFTKNVENLAVKVHKGFTIVKNNLNGMKSQHNKNILQHIYATIQQSWSHILYNYIQDKQREIIEKCNQNLLSQNLVNPQNLTTTLKQLQVDAKLKQLKLAIPLSKLYLYYKLKLTHCTIFGSTLVAKVHIPLINSNIEGEVFRTINTPLIWKNKICSLHMEENIIFKTSKYTKVISTSDKNCNEHSYPLCKIPRITITANNMQLCLHMILSSASFDKLQQNCHFICENQPKYPIITELLPNKYLITNIQQELNLVCPDDTSSKLLPATAIGTIQINIPCDCQLKLENLILITTVRPCGKEENTTNIINLIPASWTKLKTIKLFPLRKGIKHEFDNLSEILDSNWTFNNPTFEVTKLKKMEHLVLPNTDFDLFGNTKLLFYILLGWSTVLTITCLVLIYCLSLQAIQIKMLLPNRDYNQRQETH